MYDILFIIVPVFIVLTFVFALVATFSPKVRGKMLSNQMKSLKYMVDESKGDIESISTDMANATKGGVETTVRAIRKGLTEDEDIYCKYCGSSIDHDSKFCKHCGREQ